MDRDIHEVIKTAKEYYQRGNFKQAELIFREVLKVQPDNSLILNSLGNVLRANGQIDDAISCYLRVIELSPDFAGSYYNLGQAYEDIGELDKAINYYLKAVELNPNLPGAYYNLGVAFQIKGKLHEAELVYRNVIQIDPTFSLPYQNLLFIMNYNPNCDAKTIYNEHLQFAKRFEEPLLSSISPHTNDKTLNRRLKIGYVSPDFRRHSVSYFIEPVFAAHNKEQFEIFCYSLVPSEDEVTKRLQGYADHWRNIKEMSDEEAAELIRHDKIDIIIDLAGLTTHNRILLFALKPAPIQLSWIGYPATTGLAAMDYKIVDSYTDPPGMAEQFYTEKLIRMPESFLCYIPDKDSPEVSHLPALTSGHITFGSLNSFLKISPEVIDLWTKILGALQDSRLVMKTFSLVYKENRDYILDMFARRDIAAERIELLSWETSMKGHLDTYNHIDIALDTFPYNGTTTTCEALWMGVPVITLTGDTHTSRVGFSLLSNIGLPKFVAKSPDEYVGIAVKLAKDLNRLRLLRERLRDMMAHSPLMDKNRFTMNLENCYRTMWEKWCNSIQTNIFG